MLKLYRSILRRVLIYPLILLLIYWSLGCALQRKMLYPREYTQPSPQAKDGVPGLEVITLQTPEGPVEAWFIPGDAQPRTLPCARGPRRPTVIFAHGNAELIDHMAWDGLTNPYDKQAMGVFGEAQRAGLRPTEEGGMVMRVQAKHFAPGERVGKRAGANALTESAEIVRQ